MTQVSQTDEARVRAACEEALIRDCNDEALAHGDALRPVADESSAELAVAERAAWWPNPGEDPLGEFAGVTVSYSGVPAVRDVSLPVPAGEIVALIGPSGSGKSSLIRCMNRMNDLVPGTRVDGSVLYRRIGFQRPNPLPKSVYHNVAFGPRVLGFDGDMEEIVERALRRAALWDEVRDRLASDAFGLSGGQQQRLVIARCLAVDPDVLLMDEPASSLDPISTARIEDLMHELTPEVTIVIVTGGFSPRPPGSYC